MSNYVIDVVEGDIILDHVQRPDGSSIPLWGFRPRGSDTTYHYFTNVERDGMVVRFEYEDFDGNNTRDVRKGEVVCKNQKSATVLTRRLSSLLKVL